MLVKLTPCDFIQGGLEQFGAGHDVIAAAVKKEGDEGECCAQCLKPSSFLVGRVPQ